MLLVMTIGFVCVCAAVLFYVKTKNKGIFLFNDHVMITGGSSGIGLAFAIEAAKKGASVTLIARNEHRLDEAKTKVLSYVRTPLQKVFTVTADISHDYEILQRAVKEAEELLGPVTFLVNCAGTSVCHRFEDTPLEEFKRMLDVNYMGSVYATQAVLPSMKKNRNGRIIYFSSLAGLVGLYGYTAYSASKFALVGMAEALQMEVRPYNISVTVSFPPDTDTPGFAQEVKSKLMETQCISESGGLFSAQEVATKTLNDALGNHFMSSVGFEGLMLCTLCSGMTPMHSWIKLFLQVLTMGVFRLVGYNFLTRCDKTIKQLKTEKKD